MPMSPRWAHVCRTLPWFGRVEFPRKRTALSMSSIAFIDRVQDLASLSGGPVEPLQAEAFQLTRPFGHLGATKSLGRTACALFPVEGP